ncbi:NAC domain-containing protein 13-like [Solanum verrucosum]|uniref:NAC domain-containing protein 13-like n=1 Tax=Solanum verrucosum TaxID=315347 RepID=UPI0020D0E4C0|nr:NAC domain-containing protein 13-like [Solanum verrucosum]
MEFEEEGYRFHPRDSELFTYLLRFIAQKDLCDNGFITECDVYKQEPLVTYGDVDTNIFRYFISPRHKKNKSDKRFCRVVGNNLGTWKQQDKGKWVRSKQSKPLNMGRKKSLNYDTKMCCPDDGKWLMKEYVFCEAILKKFKNSNFRDYCICAIKMKNSANTSQSSNVSTAVVDFSDEQKLDTEVFSGVNSVEQRMDQEYKAITPINIVEPVLQIQESSSDEEKINALQEPKINALLESNDPELTQMWNEDYGMINHPINVVENPAMEVDDVEVQIQEAAGEGNGVLEFENTIPENNLPKEPAHLQQGFIVGVNEDCNAYSELQTNNTSFVGLLTGCGDSSIRNNWELNNFSPIQEPMIPDFANVKSNITMPETYGTLAEYMDADVLMNPDNKLINAFDFSKQAIVESNQHQEQITQKAAGEANGLLGQTVPLFQIQEFVMPENNVPEMFDMGYTLSEKSQTQHQLKPQEESMTLCETEKSNFVDDLTEALLDDVPLNDRLDANREITSTLLLDQQSWQSNAHLQDLLL